MWSLLTKQVETIYGVEMRFSVIGAGAWGTTLADLLCKKGFDVLLWARETEIAHSITFEHRNPLYNSHIALSENLRATDDLGDALKNAEIVLFVVPSTFLRTLLMTAKDQLRSIKGIINAAKGLESGTGKRLSQVFLDVLGIRENSPDDCVAILSGPNLAAEIGVGKIGAAVAACPNEAWAIQIQEAFSTKYFRVYRHIDRTGVELGGSLKNIFAIGAGIVDGLGLGDNAKAAYLTRSLHEMIRLGTTLGGNIRTFYGLSGLGDLMATAASPLSRNHQLGYALCRNETPAYFSAKSKTVVEGVETTRMAYEWGKKLTISLPITEEIYRVLFEERAPVEAAKNLMSRSLKDEEE